jgi:TetR/AcrR family transcriptional regulator
MSYVPTDSESAAEDSKYNFEPPRRMGAEGSDTWTSLLDAAERIMREKGYASVTARQLAKEAGLSPQIAYFYFRNMDDLFEALFKRFAAKLLLAIGNIKTAEKPLLALWELSSDPSDAVIYSELMSLSNHRKGLQSLIGEFGVEYNRLQSDIIRTELEAAGVNTNKWPPQVVASLLESSGRSIAFSQGFHIEGHQKVREFVSVFLEDLISQ